MQRRTTPMLDHRFRANSQVKSVREQRKNALEVNHADRVTPMIVIFPDGVKTVAVPCPDSGVAISVAGNEPVSWVLGTTPRASSK